MALSEQMTQALHRRFKWKLTNVTALDKPALIVFDYSPTDDMPPLSIGFDSAGRARCWMTETRLVSIRNKCPRHYPNYRRFVFAGREFHPFSVEAFSTSIFASIDDLIVACRTLYDHVNWS